MRRAALTLIQGPLSFALRGGSNHPGPAWKSVARSPLGKKNACDTVLVRAAVGVHELTNQKVAVKILNRKKIQSLGAPAAWHGARAASAIASPGGRTRTACGHACRLLGGGASREMRGVRPNARAMLTQS